MFQKQKEALVVGAERMKERERSGDQRGEESNKTTELTSPCENFGFLRAIGSHRRHVSSGKTSFDTFYKSQTHKVAGMEVRMTDRRLLQQCRPRMKVTWVKVVGVGYGDLDTLKN